MSGLSQHEIERRCRQSAERSQQRREQALPHGLWWWVSMVWIAILVWAALVVVAVALGTGG